MDLTRFPPKKILSHPNFENSTKNSLKRNLTDLSIWWVFSSFAPWICCLRTFDTFLFNHFCQFRPQFFLNLRNLIFVQISRHFSDSQILPQILLGVFLGHHCSNLSETRSYAKLETSSTSKNQRGSTTTTHSSRKSVIIINTNVGITCFRLTNPSSFCDHILFGLSHLHCRHCTCTTLTECLHTHERSIE